MKSMKLRALMAATFLGAATFSPASAANLQETAPTETVAAETAIVDADPALWVVKDEDTTIYLFGTIHILQPNLGWFDEAVKTAFEASDTLVLELVQPNPAVMQQKFAAVGLDSSGRTLRSKLSDEDRATYDAAMTKLGIPVAALDPFDPWAAAITVQVVALTKAGLNPESGVEAVLTNAANAAGKPIEGLETLDFQLGIFDSLSEEKQIEFLIENAEEVDNLSSHVDMLIKNWAEANSQKLAELMNEGMTDPELYAALLTNRNANWAKWIHDRMEQPGTIFVAVGAGHLAGPTNVRQLLSSYGYEAEQVEY